MLVVSTVLLLRESRDARRFLLRTGGGTGSIEAR
jgi:hypothetical protein